MSLPPGFLDELRTRTSISQIVGRKVMWDMRKSNQAKGDWWAPCPFHHEKSASFHVDDRKGFYHCFGCQASGDALKFIRETENLGFMEAVEILAAEAGMQMPARDPRAAQVADKRAELVGVMEEAVKWFRLQLSMAGGLAARDYLERRKLGPQAIARFEIGYAPDARQALFKALTEKGIAPDRIIEAGLCARPDDGRPPYDRFSGRIIYPIRDGRGRCIGLGGRAMDPNAKAKYLNSPDSEIFHKGLNLYNHAPAREACGKGAPLIVCEGYMDVIALVEAGFGGAVAPLGTAVTEDQLRLMWRIHPEPVIALDGDKAGVRAALRVIDLALPLLEAGNGLRFVVLPEGQDPDDLIKARGRGAFETLLAQAKPMVDLLWARETEGQVYDSPERRAALDKRLREVILRIKDPSIRSHYGQEINRLRGEIFGTGFGGGRQNGFGGGSFGGQNRPYAPKPPEVTGFAPQGKGARRPRWDAPLPPLAETKSSLLAGSGPEVEEDLREAMILAILTTHPTLTLQVEADLERLDLRGQGHDRLRHLLLSHAHDAPEEIRARLWAEAGETLETLLARPHIRSAPPVIKADDMQLAALVLTDEIARLTASRAARAEVEDAAHDLDGLADEGVTWRLAQAARARHEAERTELNEGAGADGEALHRAQLQAMIEGQIWIKKKP